MDKDDVDVAITVVSDKNGMVMLKSDKPEAFKDCIEDFIPSAASLLRAIDWDTHTDELSRLHA